MTISRFFPLAVLTVLCLASALVADDEKKDKDKKDASSDEVLIVTDTSGKEHKVKTWSWKQGTRRLGWLAADEDTPKNKKGKRVANGPEAFVIRENEVDWADGVLTLIPLERLRQVSFDVAKKTVTVTAIGEKDEVQMTGFTKYKNFNKYLLEAEVDKGDLGIAEVVYQSGAEGNIKSLKFPARKPETEKFGRAAVVETHDKVKETHKVGDLMPLYSINGKEKLLPTLMFKKTLKLDVAKVRSIVAANEATEVVWQVTSKEGESATLTLLTTPTLDGEKAQLMGLVAKVPVGYKLFPLRRIVSVRFDVEAVKGELLPAPNEEGKDGQDKKEKKEK